jgi:ribosomal protein L17
MALPTSDLRPRLGATGAQRLIVLDRMVSAFLRHESVSATELHACALDEVRADWVCLGWLRLNACSRIRDR